MLVLLTRPGADSARLARRFTALGARCMMWPLTEIVPTTDGVEVPLETEALVFTSANGVAAFAAANRRRDLPVLAVGDRTADAARAAGFGQVESAGGTVEHLADLLRKGEVRHLYYARGRDVSADLGALLGEEFALTEQIVYAAESGGAPPPMVATLLEAAEIDVITIWSRRAADLLAGQITANPSWHLGTTTLLAISKKAAEPLMSRRFGRVIVAERPDAAAMEAAISAALRQRAGSR